MSGLCPFRKRHPEITLHYTGIKFPVLAYKFPDPSQKPPMTGFLHLVEADNQPF